MHRTPGFRLRLRAMAAGAILVSAAVVLPAPGNAATCTITGTARTDRLTGTGRADVICGLGGNDVVQAAGGNDVVLGGPGNDRLTGGTGNDRLEGTAGADVLSGSEGADTLFGGDAGDTLDGGTGADTLSSGTGADTVTYAGRTTAVVVDLDAARGDDGALREGDTVLATERLTGGSGGDRLTGSGGVNTLAGGAGSDTLIGGLGPDVLTGGTGADTMDGGAGTDTVSYADRVTSVVVDLDGQPSDDGASGEQDSVLGTENVLGGTGDDALTGDEAANTLTGGAGDDTLTGGPGDDSIDASTGTEETTSGGPGDDTCVASDQAIEYVPGCESDGGFGTYGRVTLPLGREGGYWWGRDLAASSVSISASTLPDGDVVVLVRYSDARMRVVRLDGTTGDPVTDFGTDGWVDLGPLAPEEDTVTHWSGDVVATPNGEVVALVEAPQAYVVKLDAHGVPVPDFGTDGVVTVAEHIDLADCRLCGHHGLRLTGEAVTLGYTSMVGTPPAHQWVQGTLRLDLGTGAALSHVRAPDGMLDGGLVPSALALPGGTVLRQSTTGAVYRHSEVAPSDETLLLPASGAGTPDTPDFGSSRLVPTPDGFARITVAGTLEQLPPGYSKRLDYTAPQSVLVETFSADGIPVPLVDGAPTSYTVTLPSGQQGCDTTGPMPAVVSHAVDMLRAGVPFPVARCRDVQWLEIGPTGLQVVTARQYSTVETPRLADAVVTTAGRLVVYTQGPYVTLDLVQ